MAKIEISKEELYGLSVGSKIWFSEERLGYSIRAKGGQFLILTKPFNPKKTVLYTILNVENMVRGPENLIFGAGAETDEECEEMIARLTRGDSGLSSKRSIEANIFRVKNL